MKFLRNIFLGSIASTLILAALALIFSLAGALITENSAWVLSTIEDPDYMVGGPIMQVINILIGFSAIVGGLALISTIAFIFVVLNSIGGWVVDRIKSIQARHL